MKTSPKLVFALLALASCAAGAETYYSGQADQERRDRNREEALQNYHGENNGSSTTGMRRDRSAVREDTHEGAQKARRGAHNVADTTRRVSHKTADTARRVGHKTAVKARDITDRANAKFGRSPNTQVDQVGEKK
jgi:hypothetical protein